MTKRQFEEACRRMESSGAALIEYEPKRKYAVYSLNGKTETIGRRPRA